MTSEQKLEKARGRLLNEVAIHANDTDQFLEDIKTVCEAIPRIAAREEEKQNTFTIDWDEALLWQRSAMEKAQQICEGVAKEFNIDAVRDRYGDHYAKALGATLCAMRIENYLKDFKRPLRSRQEETPDAP